MGTFDLAKVLTHELFRSKTIYFNGVRRSPVVPERFPTVAHMLASEYNVDLNNDERIGNRLARMMETNGLPRTFSTLGTVADVIFLGISSYDLYKDFTADNVDPWKIADDFGLAVSAGIGAALGR